MKVVEFAGYGDPARVVDCVETAEPGMPTGDEVLVEVLAAPINPADVLILEGRYPGPENLPAGGGIEGCGRVLAVGPDVTDLAPEDHVMLLGRANWVQRLRAPRSAMIPVSKDIDPLQAAMMKANPASAILMLRDYVDLEPGDWVIQNAANSAVGRHVIAVARKRGLKTVNVVRRESLIAELTALGGDLVLVDGPDLAARVRDAIGESARLPLAIDAIAGNACLRLADCLSEGGTVVNYGFLSGEPCMITPTQAIVRGITLKGFWLAGFFRRGDVDALRGIYRQIEEGLRDGSLKAPVEATYPIERVKEAMAHAVQESRDGKILILPNGPLS